MARQTREGRRSSDSLLDELLAGQDPAEVFRDGTLIEDLKKAVAERALDAEMDTHLERESEQASGNHRNGHNRKPERVLTDGGALESGRRTRHPPSRRPDTTHPVLAGRHQLAIAPEHGPGAIARNPRRIRAKPAPCVASNPCPDVETRDLAVYDALMEAGR